MSEKSEDRRAIFWLCLLALAFIVPIAIAASGSDEQKEEPMRYEVIDEAPPVGGWTIKDFDPTWMIQWRTCWPVSDCSITTYAALDSSKGTIRKLEALMRDPTVQYLRIDRISHPKWRRRSERIAK